MLRKVRFLLLGAAFLLPALAPSSVLAQRAVRVGAHAGTLGPGVSVSTDIVRDVRVRMVGNYLPYGHSALIADMEVAVRLDADLRLLSLGTLVDWHPFRNAVRATAGVLFNANRVEATLTPVDSYELDGREFGPERIGDLNAQVSHGSTVAPFLGLGLAGRGGRFGASVDVGIVYTNRPAVRMSGSGMISPTARQAANLENGLSSFQWWPVLSLGLSVHTGRW